MVYSGLTTKAAILREINKPLSVEELYVPDLEYGQVLVDVKYSGICHTQLNEIQGLKGEDKFLPHVLGHEGSGIVLDVGKGVTKIEKGDHVVLTWIAGEGIQTTPAKYLSYKDEIINSGLVATFLTKTIVSENKLVKIDKRFPLNEAALLGCAVPTGAGIIEHLIDINDTYSIAIVGAGGIGQSAILASHYFNIESIIAIDIDDNRLKKAKELGATEVYNSKEPIDIKVDVAIESSGTKEGMELAYKIGETCIIAGNLPKGQTIEIDPFDLVMGKVLKGTAGGESYLDIDMPIYQELPIYKLIDRCFPLENINEAIRYMKQSTGRVLIEI